MTPLVVVTLLGGLSSVALGAKPEFGTAAEAVAMADKAVAHVKAAGAGKAYQDFTDGVPGFRDRDLYVAVYDLSGRVLAHGANPKMVGNDLLGMRDAEGKPFVRDRVNLARSKERFWHEYTFADPVTKKLVPKSTYCERVESTVVCVGIYRR
jgi:signal transduction histidine kinase